MNYALNHLLQLWTLLHESFTLHWLHPPQGRNQNCYTATDEIIDRWKDKKSPLYVLQNISDVSFQTNIHPGCQHVRKSTITPII